MNNFFEALSFLDFIKNISLFDVIFIILMIYNIFDCGAKGFSFSFISFLKWIFAYIVTIIILPKVQPVISGHIESDFINDVGIAFAIFVISLFVFVVLGRSLKKVVNWTGFGSIDKIFGLLFGVFKGYIFSVAIFTLFNWFYPYDNWGISIEKAFFFELINNGREVLIEEFPNNDDFIDDTQKKINQI